MHRRYLPLLGEAARRYRHPVGGCWRVDETYCRLKGRWAYCYRAIDQDGQVVDVPALGVPSLRLHGAVAA